MDAERFGRFVADCRKEKGMTQAGLAEALHVTDKTVSRWKRGVGFPDISTLEPLEMPSCLFGSISLPFSDAGSFCRRCANGRAAAAGRKRANDLPAQRV